MAKYEIASGTGKGYEITISVEATSNPGKDIALVISDIVEVKGNNNRNIPFFHMQTEVQIRLIDYQNQLSLFLEPYEENDVFIEITKNNETILIGNAKLEDDKFPIREMTSIIRITAHDGLTRLREKIYNSDLYDFKSRLTLILRNIFDSLDTLPVHVGLRFYHTGTDTFLGSVTGKLYRTRAAVRGFMKESETINNYELLRRFCHDFNCTVHQQNGAWYILDNHQKRAGHDELFSIKPTNEITNPDFNKTITYEELRRQNDTEPFYIPRRIYTSVYAEMDVPRDNDSLLNPSFLQWQQSDLFPLNWEYSDPFRYERPTQVPENIRAVNTGRLVAQKLSLVNTRYSNLNLNINGSIRFNGSQDTGVMSVRIARLRGFTENDVYGYNQSTNEFSTSSEGWITITQTYPSSAETVQFNIDQEIEAVESMTFYLELYYEIQQQTAGSIDIPPGFINADIRIQNSSDRTAQTLGNPDDDQALQLNLYLNEKRTNYFLSDIDYQDTSGDYIEANGNWAGLSKTEAIIQRIDDRFSAKRTIFDLYYNNEKQYNLTDRITFTFRGTTYFCTPLRIRNYANKRQPNEIRLLSLR